MAADGYVPEDCVWELTLKCNMRCLHCGSSAGRARRRELTVEECLSVADQLLELGCQRVTLIGGEVFFFRGWERVARRMTDGGAEVNIITNAFRLGDREIAQIRAAGLSNVGVSVDGLEKTHDRVRGVPGSYARALRALEKLQAEGIYTAVVTTLLSFTLPDLPGLHAVLTERGVNVWQIQLATPMGAMAERRELLFDPQNVPRVSRFIRKKREEGPIRLYAGDDIGYYDENELYLRNRPGTLAVWGGCQAGLRVIGIDSAGNVKGCESLYDERFIEGNVLRESLAAIWQKPGSFAYNREFDVGQLTGRCSGCDKAAICRGGCRGVCYFTSENLFENPYCSYARTERR